ncbi:hypothetical protein [Clostridium tagluense]|uniref:hypothetical protein n=1 Tax=Clostridium tagluense TaxID=360422 RepID=UPI001CF564FB|nr:hypothetical protein [Clostridium tagluense]MCB2300675.1 hypothetical protein [Clostridium tagluense]
MFIFRNETELTNYIIENKDKIPQLKNKIIIDGERIYGRYSDKNYKFHYKYSDLVMSDHEITSLIEIRCGYITPELITKSIQAMTSIQFYRNVGLIFIGTKISDEMREKLENYKSDRIKYIILDDVKYQKSEVKIEKNKFELDIEMKFYFYINYVVKIKYFENKELYVDKERTELKLDIVFDNGYGFNIIKNMEDGYSCEIVKLNEHGYNVLTKKTFNGRYVHKQLRNVYYFLHNIKSNYLDSKNVNDMVDSIVYSSSYIKLNIR